MSISIRSVTSPTSSSTATKNVAAPAGLTAGDFLLAIVYQSSESVNQFLPPDDDTWYYIRDAGVNGRWNIHCWYKVAGGSEPSSYDFTSPSGSSSIIGIGLVALFASGGQIGIADVESQSNASSTNRTYPALTFPAAGLFLATSTADNTSASTPPGTFTEQWDVTVEKRAYLMYDTVASAGSDGPHSATGTAMATKTVSIALVESAPTNPGVRFIRHTEDGPTSFSSSATLTMPTCADGDILVAHLVLPSSRTVTTPSGWTLAAAQTTNAYSWVFWKEAAAADSGATLTINFTGGSVTGSIAVSVYRSPDGDALTVGDIQTASRTASATITFPSATSTQDGALLLMLSSKTNITQYKLTNDIDMWERYDFGASTVRPSVFTEMLVSVGATGTRDALPTTGTTPADVVSLIIEPTGVEFPAPTVYASAFSTTGIVVSGVYAPPDGVALPTSWKWEYSTDNSTWHALATTTYATPYYRHTGLTPGTLYYYRAYLSGGGTGITSNVASATTLSDAGDANGVALWIDVRDASNNKLGPGPLTEVVSWRNVRRLSRAGEFSAEFPAMYTRLHQTQSDGDPLLHNERYLFCYGILNGAITLIGAGLIKSIDLKRQGGQAPTLVVTGPDLLGELRRVTVFATGRPYQYEIDDSDSAPDDLMTDFGSSAALPASWTIDGGNPTDTNVTAKFVHATLLNAFIDIGSKLGEFFRLGSGNGGRELKWLGPPSDFVDCGITAVWGADPVAATGHAEIALITNLSEIRDSWDLYNRAYVFGAGQGHDRLDLAAVTLWPDGHRYRSTIVSVTGDGTTVTVTTSEDHDITTGDTIVITGTANYDTAGATVASTPTATTLTFLSGATGATSTGYIYGDQTHTMDGEDYFIQLEDSRLSNLDSRTAYGRHYTAIQFKEISPLSNSDADVSAAANALLAAAYYWLREHSHPAKFYSLALTKCDALLLPGQTIRAIAKGFVDGTAWVDIDTTLTILESTTEIGRGGVRTTGLVVATANRWPATDGDQAAQEFQQAQAYQSLAQLAPSVDTVSYREHVDDDTGATVYFFLGDETAIVNQVIIRFRTDKLRSTVKSVGGSSTTTDSGGGSTPTTDSGGGSTPTSSSGGGSTPTTTSYAPVTNHAHALEITDSSPTGAALYYDSATGLNANLGTGDESGGATSLQTLPLTHDHDVTIAAHTHDVTIAAHTHDVTIAGHTHDVTIAAHTHDVTASVATTYGIYEDPGTAYGPTDLEFSINGNAYRSDYNAISGASGWYELDVTDEVAGLAQRPLQVANSVAIQVKSASQTGKLVQVTLQIERRCVIQSIATL